MLKTIKFYRHGETYWNEKGMLQGWLDSPLTPKGISQLQSPSWQPDFVISSDLGRAIQTAQYLFPLKQIHTDVRLREIYLGEWQGCFIHDLRNTEEYQYYERNPAHFKPNSQESFFEVSARMKEVLKDLRELPFDNIAVVTHGVSLACLQIALEKQNWCNIWERLIDNGDSLTLNFEQ